MIVLTVQSFNGAATDALSASFDELGGTIGRADSNQLVLPDPERSISRIHAQVVYRNGGYSIADRGSNAVLVNGRPVGNGREAPIRDGDQVQIGGYVMAVSFGHKTQAKDPFADLFGSGSAGAPSPFAKPASAPPPPFAAPAAAWPAAARPAASPPAASAGGIPDDWDPFAADAGKTGAAAAGAGGGAFGLDFGAPASAGAAQIPGLPVSTPAGSDSLDSLFGLGASSGGDPFGSTPAATPLAMPNTAADADPLRALGLAGKPMAPQASDHAPDLNTPWTAPALTPLHKPAATPAPPPGAVLSWDQPSREAKVVTMPGVRRSLPDAVEPADRTRIVIGGRPPAPAAAASAPRSPTAPPDALLAALLEGLGAPDLKLDVLDAPRMRLVGQLLREATRGSVELLVARAALKREMRAQMTMIVARENNPLKFSPTVEVALQHLLGAPTPGFLAPPKAMRDAFDDLRAHQLGVMAGMRAALEGVLQRFDPAVLEAKMTKRNALADIIPGSRKARLWEMFQELYSQLSAEAADDFQELFGKAFLRAYEAQLDQLQSED